MRDLFLVAKKDVLQKSDKSRKGSIDEQMLPLIAAINSKKDYYTTSSCSGRVGILLPGIDKPSSRWLLVSHGKLGLDETLRSLREGFTGEAYLRQESFILHVCCRTIGHADALLRICKHLGLKRAGAISLSRKITVELVGTEHLDCLIGRDGEIYTGEKHLMELIGTANKRLGKNSERLKKIEIAIREKL